MKNENTPFDTIVGDALAKMREVTAAAPSYDLERSSGQWIVKRASRTGALFPYDAVAEATEKAPASG